jgi:hypothetical protein
MLLLLAVASAGAACDAPTTSADLGASLAVADQAFAAMDLDAFQAAVSTSDATLACLREVLTPFDVAAWARVQALHAYVATETDQTVQWFSTSLAIQPMFALPTSIAPDGNPLQALYVEARDRTPAEASAVTPPPGGVLYIDGARATTRPGGRPSLMQAVAADGTLRWSASVGASDPLPDWTTLGFEAPVVVEQAPIMPSPVASSRGGPSVGLLAGAGGAAVVSGGLYAYALVSRGQYDDLGGSELSTEDLARMRSRINTSVGVSAGVGALAVGLGTVAFIVPL